MVLKCSFKHWFRFLFVTRFGRVFCFIFHYFACHQISVFQLFLHDFKNVFYEGNKKNAEGFILPEEEKFTEWVMSGDGPNPNRKKHGAVQL